MRAAVVIAIVFGTAGTAQADTFDETFDASYRFGGGWFEARDLPLEVVPTDEAPALLADAEPILQRNGRAGWGKLRANLHLDGFRFGAGWGFLGVDGLAVSMAPLDGGATVAPGRLWGTMFEAFAGYAIGDPREVRPYLEVRGSFTLLETELELELPTGSGGSTGYQAYVPGLGFSAGILVPMGEFVFVDAGVEVDVLGAMHFAPFAGFGFPIPLSHL